MVEGSIVLAAEVRGAVGFWAGFKRLFELLVALDQTRNVGAGILAFRKTETGLGEQLGKNPAEEVILRLICIRRFQPEAKFLVFLEGLGGNSVNNHLRESSWLRQSCDFFIEGV